MAMPQAGGLEHGHPHAAVFAIAEDGTRELPLVPLAGHARKNIFITILRYGHDHRLAVAHEVQQETVARQFRLGHGHVGGVDHDVVSEEVGHEEQPAPRLDPQRGRLLQGVGLDERRAHRQLEAERHSGAVGGHELGVERQRPCVAGHGRPAGDLGVDRLGGLLRCERGPQGEVAPSSPRE